MTRAEKIEKRKNRSIKRAKKNNRRNKGRSSWRNLGNRFGVDCPYQVELYGMYGTCSCGGSHYNDCLSGI